MYALDWTVTALDDLADVFVGLDLNDQDRLAAAVEAMNRRLVLDPLDEGESRDAGYRLTFLGYAVVLFWVGEAKQLVQVHRVAPWGD
jgi:hypothetical protein